MNGDSAKQNVAKQGRTNRIGRIAPPVGVGALMVIAIGTVNSAAGDHASSAPASVMTAEAVQQASVDSRSRVREAGTVLWSAEGTRIGTVTFKRKGSRTEVSAKLALPENLSALDAFHGFHIHANNAPENGEGCVADPAQPPATWFVSADAHLSEPEQKHSRHAGDLPSLLVNDDGSAVISFTSTRLDVADLKDRAVVLHAGPDNFANVPTGGGADQYTANSPAATAKTAATGNAGDRIACGVLTIRR